MKKFLMFALVPLMSGCLFYKEMPVEYDYSYKGKFKKYKTFGFLDNQNKIQYGSVDEADMQYFIIKHMNFLGYKEKVKKPDLLISYTFFEDSLKFRGYLQPELDDWIKNPQTNLNYNSRSYDIDKGTLLIQLYDRKRAKTIWQGYSTEVYGEVDFKNGKDMRNVVRSILDKYQVFAEGFIEGEVQTESKTED